MEVAKDKVEAIYDRIGKLAAEVDKRRTNSEAVFALMIETGGALGKAAEKAKPFTDAIERILKIIYRAKEEDLPPQLPPPKKPKQIEGLRKRGSKPDAKSNDEDPPF